MPENKKHHYVPRFYLKRFSTNGCSICLWNIKNELKVSSANLKNQCYKDYFYGKELITERALGKIEGEVAPILKLVDNDEKLPPYESNEYIALIIYILIQYVRTTYQVDTIDEMTDRMMKHLFWSKAKSKGIDLSKVNIGIKNAAQYSLGMVIPMYPLMLDLKCKLLINLTNVEFVTSDNPVVLYNQLFSFREDGSNTGFASKGLQVFLPISSNKLLIFFDSNSYSFGNKKESVIKVTLPRDVYELNTLQMTSAYENVYFEKPNFNISALFRKSLPFRRKQKTNFSIFHGEETPDTKRELIAQSKEDVRTNLKLSFARITRATKAWREKFKKQRAQPTAVFRNLKLLDDYKEFMNKVDKISKRENHC